MDKYIGLIGKKVFYRDKETGGAKVGEVSSIHIYIGKNGIGSVKVHMVGSEGYVRYEQIEKIVED